MSCRQLEMGSEDEFTRAMRMGLQQFLQHGGQLYLHTYYGMYCEGV